MENKKTVYCTHCGKMMSETGSENCSFCGEKQGGRVIHCLNCGHLIETNQEICLNCGTDARKISHQRKIRNRFFSFSGVVHPVMAVIVGFIIPGLPSILWYDQKIKGVTVILVSVVYYLVLLGWIIGIIAAVDAYQLGKRVNNGEKLKPWTFFWDK